MGEALLHAAVSLLATPDAMASLQYSGDSDDFGMRLADSMAEWGQKHLSLLEPSSRTSFLQQVWMRSSLGRLP